MATEARKNPETEREGKSYTDKKKHRKMRSKIAMTPVTREVYIQNLVTYTRTSTIDVELYFTSSLYHPDSNCQIVNIGIGVVVLFIDTTSAVGQSAI